MADPQRLIPKVRGQVQAQPDGWGMSASQNDLPVGIDFIRQLVKKFTNPNDPMQPIPMGNPVGAGMVLSEQNISKILNRMAEITPYEHGDLAKEAVSYMAAKYPKLFSLPEHIAIKIRGFGQGQSGRYLPDSNTIQLNSDAFNQPGQAVGSLAHEITHALQKSRGETFRDYVEPGLDFSGYRAQPTEINANRAAETAKSTYADFVAKVAAMRAAQGK